MKKQVFTRKYFFSYFLELTGFEVYKRSDDGTRVSYFNKEMIGEPKFFLKLNKYPKNLEAFSFMRPDTGFKFHIIKSFRLGEKLFSLCDFFFSMYGTIKGISKNESFNMKSHLNEILKKSKANNSNNDKDYNFLFLFQINNPALPFSYDIQGPSSGKPREGSISIIGEPANDPVVEPWRSPKWAVSREIELQNATIVHYNTGNVKVSFSETEKVWKIEEVASPVEFSNKKLANFDKAFKEVLLRTIERDKSKKAVKKEQEKNMKKRKNRSEEEEFEEESEKKKQKNVAKKNKTVIDLSDEEPTSPKKKPQPKPSPTTQSGRKQKEIFSPPKPKTQSQPEPEPEPEPEPQLKVQQQTQSQEKEEIKVFFTETLKEEREKKLKYKNEFQLLEKKMLMKESELEVVKVDLKRKEEKIVKLRSNLEKREEEHKKREEEHKKREEEQKKKTKEIRKEYEERKEKLEKELEQTKILLYQTPTFRIPPDISQLPFSPSRLLPPSQEEERERERMREKERQKEKEKEKEKEKDSLNVYMESFQQFLEWHAMKK